MQFHTVLTLWGLLYVLIKIFILSADNMALLAEEVCGCKAELLSGGLSGKNAATIIKHLWGRQPVLIPYPRPKQNFREGCSEGEYCNFVFLFFT